MTLTALRPGPWSTRPGWGISADLTPPEVLAEREVARTRRRLLLALAGLLLVVVVAVGLAVRHHASAESALQEQQTTQTQLLARAREFRDVTDMQRSLSRLRSQTATVMVGDVDVEALTARLSSALVPGMRLTSETVSFTPAATSATGASGSAQTGSIGRVTLVGEGNNLDDLATYVERLQRIKGLAEIVPTSNATSKDGVTYTVTFDLTAALLSHRFDQQGTSS